MARRTLWFVLFALVAGAVCVRLGFWQLARNRERREANARISARLLESPIPFATVASLGDSARFRRVTLTGIADYAHEVVHAARTHGGSPGVNLLTPLRISGSDTAVLVNRGWVYSPDGAAVDHERWREGDTLQVTGFVEEFVVAPRAAAGASRTDRVVRSVDRGEIARLTGAAIAPVYVVATEVVSRPARAAEAPVRLTPPELGTGPHLGYAIQWFAFAAIALIGTAIVAKKDR